MDRKPLSTLISELEQELLRLGYTKGSMTFYRRRWKQLMEYAEKRGEQYYTEQLGIDFVYEFFSITQDDFARVLGTMQSWFEKFSFIYKEKFTFFA